MKKLILRWWYFKKLRNLDLQFRNNQIDYKPYKEELELITIKLKNLE